MAEECESQKDLKTAMAELDALVASQKRSSSADKARAGDLKWLARITYLGLPFIGVSPYLFKLDVARVVCTYSLVCALVLAGWGIYRTTRAGGSYKAATCLYGIYFVLVFLLCVGLLFSKDLGEPWMWTVGVPMGKK
ncbi:MAG TPA: hypothetical protein VGP72_11395 [Planctomycetota bacterium]|jgi:hypothetical protein